jgi:tRNA-2-methylthio-N6-dimethylallyladenosine synthase
MGDDVPEQLKVARLNEIIDLQREISFRRNQGMIGRTVEVLVEGPSKKSNEDFSGRTDTNKMVVFPKGSSAVGQYRPISIERANSATLFGSLAHEAQVRRAVNE